MSMRWQLSDGKLVRTTRDSVRDLPVVHAVRAELPESEQHDLDDALNRAQFPARFEERYRDLMDLKVMLAETVGQASEVGAIQAVVESMRLSERSRDEQSALIDEDRLALVILRANTTTEKPRPREHHAIAHTRAFLPRRLAERRARNRENELQREYHGALERHQVLKKELADIIVHERRLSMEIDPLVTAVLDRRLGGEEMASEHATELGHIHRLEQQLRDDISGLLSAVAETWVESRGLMSTEAKEATDPASRPVAPIPQPISTEGSTVPVTAFVSWAHASPTDTAAPTQAAVLELTQLLRADGVDADMDLFHLHDRDINWQTYGPSAIQTCDYVLIVASRGYKERWEGVNPPSEGAGAAREANVLKGRFDTDQRWFQRSIKLIVLEGTGMELIPAELGGLQRFHIPTLDQTGVTDLIRTLTGQPAYVKRPVGPRPDLPPKM